MTRDLFQARDQQITPLEAFLGPVVLWNEAAALAEQDILWFVDNQAAMASLIKGSSSQCDICTVAAATSLWSARLDSRIWFEYVESEANISDGLSRLGLSDPWTCSQGWALFPALIPPFKD